MERIKEIEERLNKLTLRGHKGFDAREEFESHAETDIEYLLAENKRLRGVIIEAKEALDRQYRFNSGIIENNKAYMPLFNEYLRINQE